MLEFNLNTIISSLKGIKLNTLEFSGAIPRKKINNIVYSLISKDRCLIPKHTITFGSRSSRAYRASSIS